MAQASPKDSKVAPAPNEDLPPEYVMPRPAVGQAVLYFPHGIRTKDSTQIAWVLRLGLRSLDLVLSGNRAISSVRFVDDPRAKEPSGRIDGLWDFNDWDKKLREFLGIT